MTSYTLNWFLLIVAGIFEIIWAYFLKHSKGLTLLFPSIMFLITLALSMWLLALSLRSIPIGVAYPIWTSIGAIGTVIVGYFLFKEPLGWLKFLFILMILTGTLGLKIISE